MPVSAADEPRRSGRATKGQHKNLDSGDETPKPKKASASTPAAAAAAAAVTASTPSASSSKKSAKKSAKPEPEEAAAAAAAAAEEGGDDDDDDEDDGEEEDDVVRCVCGDTSEKGPPDFVSCDACQVWQHNLCMDLPTDPDLLPEHYLCEQCKPDDHQILLSAIERGEKPWETRLKAWRNAKKRGKKGRKTLDRQSTASELKSDHASAAAVSSSPAPPASQTSGTKRKFEDDSQASFPDVAIKQSSPAPSAAPAATPVPAATPAPVDDAAAAPVAEATPAPASSPTPGPGKASAHSSAPAASTPSLETAADTAASDALDSSAAVVSPPLESAQLPAKKRVSSAGEKRPEKRRKSSAPEKKVDVETALVDIDQLPQERRKPAEALGKVISDYVNTKSKAGTYRVPDGHTPSSLAKYHAVRIEYALYMHHGPFKSNKLSEAYGNQFRAIIANLKRNTMLIDRLLNSDLTADELAVMSTEDMASEEEQKKRAAMKEELAKQSVMVQEDDRPRVRRTHRGDEYVDDESSQQEHSVSASRPVRHREPEAENTTAGSPAATDELPAMPASADRMDIDGPSDTPTDRRASAQQFDITNVWAKTHHSPDAEQRQQQQQQARPLQQPPRRRSSIQKQVQQEGEKNDADVDRLLADDDDNDDEYNPADLALSDGTVWRGELIQPGVTQLTTNGRFVAGNDFGRYVSWESFLPKVLEIEGRLESKRADDYLCGLQWSKKSDVAVLALSPYNNRQAFDHIFEYFASRSRYAVIRKGHGMSDIVKDVYITPVAPGTSLPPHLELLEHSTLENPLTDRILLVTFVVNKPAHWDNPATAPIPFAAQAGQNNGNGIPPHLQTAPAASPIGTAPPAPAFSPRPEQGFTPAQSQNGGYPYGAAANTLPPNPYSAPAPTAGMTPSQYPGVTQQHPLAYPTPPHLNPLVARILGPLANAPTVQHILQSAGSDIHENILQGMKTILDTDPSAAEDLSRFTAHLGLSSSQGH